MNIAQKNLLLRCKMTKKCIVIVTYQYFREVSVLKINLLCRRYKNLKLFLNFINDIIIYICKLYVTNKLLILGI